MSHSFGKVILSAQLAVGFAIGDRRPRRQDHRQPRGREAHLHGRRAPHLREGVRQDRLDHQAEGGVKAEDLRRGPSPPARSTNGASPRARSVSRGLAVRAPPVRPARVLESARERSADACDSSSRVRRHSTARSREWFHSAGILIVEGYGLTETAAGAFCGRPVDNRFGTVGRALPGSEVRIGDGRRDSAPRPAHHGGIQQPSRRDGRGLHGGRLVAHRRSGVARRRRIPDDHRAAERPHQDVGRQDRGAGLDRGGLQGVCPYVSQVLVFGDAAPVLRRAHHARPGCDHGVGGGERTSPVRLRRAGVPPEVARARRPAASTELNAAAQQVGDDQALARSSTPTSRSRAANSPRR